MSSLTLHIRNVCFDGFQHITLELGYFGRYVPGLFINKREKISSSPIGCWSDGAD
jgi:hypothetical protein